LANLSTGKAPNEVIDIILYYPTGPVKLDAWSLQLFLIFILTLMHLLKNA